LESVVQVELHGARGLRNGKIYPMNKIDMHVVVKYRASRKETGTCTCPPVGHCQLELPLFAVLFLDILNQFVHFQVPTNVFVTNSNVSYVFCFDQLGSNSF